jgi:hypothetical protein
MNFNELFQKMRELDQPVGEELKGGQKKLDADNDGDIEADDLKDLRDKKVDEELVDECGMGPMSGPQDQQDNVNMSINMSGSGSGGIRDLLDILRNIESGSDGMDGGMDGGDLGKLIGNMDKEPIIGGKIAVDEFANEPDEMYAPVSAVTPTGDDLHSQGGEAPKVNGGGNPMTMESLILRLGDLYQDVKSR